MSGPSRPGGLGWPQNVAALLLVALSALAAKEMRMGETSMGLSKPLEEVVNTLVFPGSDVRLRTVYTGISTIDYGLRFLVAAFLPGAAGWDKNSQIQQIYFLLSFFPIIALWSVEAGRTRNAGSLIRWTSIWALFYQTVGGAIIIPLYYLTFVMQSKGKAYWERSSRQVPTAYAKALLPSLVLGYLLPTIAMYLPFSDPQLQLTQALIAFWQPCPLLVNILLVIFATAYGNGPASKEKTAPRTDSLKYLDRLYMLCFVTCAIVHIGTMLLFLFSTDPHISFTQALIHLPANERLTMAACLHYVFQVDLLIIIGSALIATYLTLLDLKKAGLTQISLVNSAIGMLVGTVLVGPAATISGVWYYREHSMAKKFKE